MRIGWTDEMIPGRERVQRLPPRDDPRSRKQEVGLLCVERAQSFGSIGETRDGHVLFCGTPHKRKGNEKGEFFDRRADEAQS